jgi:hypothetical protein
LLIHPEKPVNKRIGQLLAAVVRHGPRFFRKQAGYIIVESTVTGGAATNFLTSPTYDTVKDKPPEGNQNQVAVTALGGTQTLVRTHTSSDPFTATAQRPKVVKTLQAVGTDLDQFNTTSLLTRKGVKCRSTGEIRVMLVRTTWQVPVGAEVYDAVNVAAAHSFHAGITNEESSGIADTLATGILGEQT